MTIRELNEKRNRLLSEARQLMTAADVTAETRTKVDAMLTDANGLKSDIERLESCAETEERSLSAARPPREGVESESADTRTYEERNKATNVALRKYLRNERFEQRDLTVAADGGVMIPVAAVQPVQAQRSAGSIYDIVKHLRTDTGEDVRVPLWDDTGNGMVLDSVAVAVNDPNISGVTIKVDGFRLNPVLVDNKLIADLSYDLVADVQQSFRQRYLRGISQFVVQGNGSNFTALSAPSALTTSVTAKIGYADLVALMTALDPAYAPGAAFSFSTATLGQILNIVDGNARPIFLPFTEGATSGFAGTIFGFPVKIDQYAPTIATGNQPVRFGDHAAAYTVREINPGVVIKQSADRWIELNRLGIVGFARAGGAPTIASATFPSLVSLTVK